LVEDKGEAGNILKIVFIASKQPAGML